MQTAPGTRPPSVPLTEALQGARGLRCAPLDACDPLECPDPPVLQHSNPGPRASSQTSRRDPAAIAMEVQEAARQRLAGQCQRTQVRSEPPAPDIEPGLGAVQSPWLPPPLLPEPNAGGSEVIRTQPGWTAIAAAGQRPPPHDLHQSGDRSQPAALERPPRDTSASHEPAIPGDRLCAHSTRSVVALVGPLRGWHGPRGQAGPSNGFSDLSRAIPAAPSLRLHPGRRGVGYQWLRACCTRQGFFGV